MIKARKLADQIKLIGVGVKNSIFEVETFRKTYKIEFPMSPDQKLVVHKAWGKVWTPHFFVVKKAGDGSLKVLISHEGPVDGAEKFLDEIIKKAGL